MKHTVKDVIHNLGSGADDVAKHVGRSSLQLAKRVKNGTTSLAHDIGPKRGLIGLAIFAVAVGGTIVLVRYLRARADELPIEGEDLDESTSRRAKRRAKRDLHAEAAQ